MSTHPCLDCQNGAPQTSTAVRLVTYTRFASLWLVQVEDEMDELVLMDDETMDLPPEDLPRRVLSDFAVYNSEGFCTTLELLPMWSGVDCDVDLYASGNVLDDDGEWAGGQALNTGMCPVLDVNLTLFAHLLHMPVRAWCYSSTSNLLTHSLTHPVT